MEFNIESRLSDILEEVCTQNPSREYYPSVRLSFSDEMAQIHEFIELEEYGLAYESMVINLEEVPFQVSSSKAVKLLEVGLIMKFKTERDEDDIFNISLKT